MEENSKGFENAQNQEPVNLDDLPESTISTMLEELESTLRELEDQELQVQDSGNRVIDDVEEQELREFALNSMSAVEKDNEDLIEFTLNEIERQSVESPEDFEQKFPITLENKPDENRFPTTSSNLDASANIFEDKNNNSKINAELKESASKSEKSDEEEISNLSLSEEENKDIKDLEQLSEVSFNCILKISFSIKYKIFRLNILD